MHSLRYPHRRWVVLALLAITGLSVGTPLRAVSAASPIFFEEAVRQGLLEVLITGNSLEFSEPMLSAAVRNTTTELLAVTARVGLEFSSNDPSFADLVLGKEFRLDIRAGEERTVALHAFSLDVNRSFPPPEARYTVEGMTTDVGLLSLLDRITERGADGELAAQLAVWMVTMDYDFEQVEKRFEVSLTRYQTRTLELLGVSGGPGIPSSTEPIPTVVSPVFSEERDPVPGPNQEEGLPFWVIGTVSGVSLAIALGVLGHTIVQRRPARTGGKSEQSRSAPFARQAPKQTSAPDDNSAEELCLGCRKPFGQCTCPVGRTNRARASGHDLEPGGSPMDKAHKTGDEAHLVGIEGTHLGSTFVFPDEGEFLVSRAELPYLTIPLPTVSAPHALLYLDRHRFRIKDLNSSNGTTAGEHILQRERDGDSGMRECILRDGMPIRLGDVSLVFKTRPPHLRDQEGRTYEFPEGRRIIVTRLQLPYVIISEASISAPHALVRCAKGRYTARDLQSGNGTQLGIHDGHRWLYRSTSGTAGLENGQRLRMGKEVFKVSIPVNTDSVVVATE